MVAVFIEDESAGNGFWCWFPQITFSPSQAFEGFYIPVLQIIKTELRTFGMKNFLLAGLPASFASAMLSSWRKYWMSNHLKQLLTDSHLRTILYASDCRTTNFTNFC